MSGLEGNLTAAALQEILELLVQKNPAATLLISDGRDEKVVYFSTGGIRLYSTEARRVSRLEDFLVHRRLVERGRLDVALEAVQRGHKEGLDEVLERMEILPRARFQEAVSELILSELCDLVTWENAIYEFYEGNPPPAIFDQEHPALFAALDVKALASRVREWGQEWAVLKSKVYSERLRPRWAAPAGRPGEKKGLPPALQKLERSMDGQRTLRELARLAGADFKEAARHVRDGLKEGILRATLVAEKEPTTSEEVMGEIERLEEALDKAINTILIHKRIATGYEKIDQKDRASEHYQAIADLHAEAGRMAKAMENYQRAITLSPQNIGAHETLIRRLQETGQEERALDEIVTLAKKLVSFGLVERAWESLRAVMGKAAHLFQVRLLFADVLGTLGKVPEAIAEYLGIAREKKRTGATDGIEDIYRKILALDPGNREARAGLSQERRRQVGKWLVLANRVSAAAALVLISTWSVNELSARVSFGRVAEAARGSMARGEMVEGLEKLRGLGARYPGNLACGSLPALEEKLFQEAFYRVEGDLERAVRLRKEGRFAEAREVFQSVAESRLVDSQSERARRGIQEIEAYRRQWMELRRSAELFVNARLYPDAFKVCRRIIDHYPEGVEGLQVPFFITSEPPGADLKVNGVHLGTTPLWVPLPFGTQKEVTVEKSGFAPQSVQGFASRRSPYINLVLKKESRLP
jgi:tetratricopeptide (TPR) repeat protein